MLLPLLKKPDCTYVSRYAPKRRFSIAEAVQYCGVLNSLHSTDAIPHSTDGISPQYWCYPLAVLNSLRSTDASHAVLNSLRSTEPTLYGVLIKLEQKYVCP